MYLKFETTLNVYQHEDKMVLCRVHVISPVADKTRNGDKTFSTCRPLTTHQWSCFDKELKSWLDTNREWADIDVDKELHKFSVKPNVEVKIKRSKVSSKYFNRCLYKPPIDTTDDVASKDSLPVLDCSLEYKTAKVVATTTIPTEEYNPSEYDPYAPLAKEQSICPPSYKPYTPTKRTRKNSSIDSIKPQDQYFLGFDSSEDTYSPNIERHLAASKISIPVYKPAPIDETRSPDPDNQVILESDEEIMPTKTHRSIRVRDKHIYKTDSEYIPHSQETHEVVPAYKPTPIEKTDEDYGTKRIKEDLDAGEKTKSQTKKQSKQEKVVANEKQEKSSREEKSKTAYINEKKLTKDTNKLAAPSSDDDKESQSVTNKMIKDRPSTKSETGGSSKKSSLSISVDEFERIESKDKSSSSNKPRIERKRSQSTDSKSKESTSGDKGTKSTINLPSIEEQSENNDTEERERKRKNKNKSPKTEKHSSKEYLTNESETCSLKQDRTSEDEFEASASKSKGKKKEKSSSLDAIKDDPMAEEIAAGVKEKKKDKRKEKLKTNDNNATQEEKENSKDITEQPLRPKRFIEEVGQHERKKKQKSSPKNKELFGTDDDDDNEVEDNSSKLLSSDNNNNVNSKMHSVFETPKTDKKTKAIIMQSSSPSPSAKNKRKNDDCEQEKAGKSKWLGKNQQSDDLINDESPKSSLKCTKKIKSLSKDDKRKRLKSPSPQPMEIVMSPEKELEMMSNKAKQQSAI